MKFDDIVHFTGGHAPGRRFVCPLHLLVGDARPLSASPAIVGNQDRAATTRHGRLALLLRYAG